MMAHEAETGDAEMMNDADLEMAALEAAGRAAGHGRKRMRALLAEGRHAEAARACHHGAGYPTNSPAADNERDPRAGQPGHRCSDCGSWFSPAQLAPITDRCGVQLSALRRIPPAAPCELAANPITAFAEALNPPAGALSDALPFSLTAPPAGPQQPAGEQPDLFTENER